MSDTYEDSLKYKIKGLFKNLDLLFNLAFYLIKIER